MHDERSLVRYSLRVTDERRRNVLSLATLSLAALILGHHVVFLSSYGPAYWVMLERTGHGPIWATTVATVALLTTGLLLLALRRIVGLSRLARSARAGEVFVPESQPAHLASHVLRIWAVILAVSLAMFVLNENLERASSGFPIPGLAVLLGAGGHAGPVAVFAAVSAAVALVAGLYRWRRDILIARLTASHSTWPRSTEGSPPRPEQWRPRRISLLASRLAGRGPPVLASVRSLA